ncbi:MAG TPA: hypothetical protein VIG90_17110 [Pedomonas sp.]|uniref:hypothetical protein n=1 Tax=Pedomonas sp. TaxID=2976421 RepID=UPI002F4283C4
MRPLLVAAVFVGLSVPALAADVPPQGARPLSEITTSIEARDDFVSFVSIEYKDDVYKIRYRTRGGDERNIVVDPLSGTEKKKD